MLRDDSFLRSVEKKEELIQVYTEKEDEHQKSLAAVKGMSIPQVLLIV